MLRQKDLREKLAEKFAIVTEIFKLRLTVFFGYYIRGSIRAKEFLWNKLKTFRF